MKKEELSKTQQSLFPKMSSRNITCIIRGGIPLSLKLYVRIRTSVFLLAAFSCGSALALCSLSSFCSSGILETIIARYSLDKFPYLVTHCDILLLSIHSPVRRCRRVCNNRPSGRGLPRILSILNEPCLYNSVPLLGSVQPHFQKEQPCVLIFAYQSRKRENNASNALLADQFY